MIKIKELRIGNRISIEGEIDIVEVTSLCDDGEIGTTAYFDGLKGCNDCTECTAIPIPLTPEILEKCGFINDLSIDRSDYRLTGKWVYNGFEIWADWVGQQCLYDRTSLRHLHQLQNLYFSLIGEELEVKL